ncbi:hypothetical protein Slin14017_G016560 [Septoria linicola]|nr:hypothetical protein Slin14017_G016560 [Septoria linicola]
MATIASPGTYLHAPPSMPGYASRVPSPPTSQPDSVVAQAMTTSQQETINRLRDEKERLVGDKDRLMTEKDALVNEKLRLVEDKERAAKDGDDLLSSKTKLWQDYYQAVKAKDEEIASLQKVQATMHDELVSQRKKNKRLAKALSEYMEMDDVDAQLDEHDTAGEPKIKLEPVLQTAPVPRASKTERTSSWLEAVPEASERLPESRKQLQEIFGGDNVKDPVEDCAEPPERSAKRARLSNGESLPASNDADRKARLSSQCTDITHSLDKVQEVFRERPYTPPPPGNDHAHADQRRTDEVEEIATPSSQQQLLTTTAGLHKCPISVQTSVTLTKLKADFLVPMAVMLRPVIRQKVASGGYGQLNKLDNYVLESLCDVLGVLKERNDQGRIPLSPRFKTTKGCCWTWMHGSGHDTRWTRDRPKLFACRSCFQVNRACMVWQGKGIWDLLPLPPQVRTENATYTDAGYYIYGKSVSLSDFSGVWEDLRVTSVEG